MFKCKRCNSSQKKGNTQFKIRKTRSWRSEDGFPGRQTSKEEDVCFGCYKKDKK